MLDEALRWEVFRRDGFACGCCGTQSRLTVDHIQPQSRGGGDEPENLRTLCRYCNSSKSARADCHLVHRPTPPATPALGPMQGPAIAAYGRYTGDGYVFEYRWPTAEEEARGWLISIDV